MAATHPGPLSVEGFLALAQALPCSVWIADAAGTIEWHGDQGGWLPSVHPADQPSIARDWGLCLATGTGLDAVVRRRDDGGSYRWTNVRARPSHEASGAVTGWFGTLTDIHDRQTAAAATTHVVEALMKGYLSKPFPIVSGVEFDTLYRPADVMERIGGDWYDVFELPDGRIGFSLGDVCGHGIDAAVKMGEAKQAIFLAACLGDPAPENVLRRANQVLFVNDHHASITTALYGIVDIVRRTVTYASAGHHPPILARSTGAAVVLPNHGFPLGVELHMPPRLKTHEFAYEAGSTLFLYTDGLIEFTHDLAEGEERLLAAAAEAVRSKAAQPAKFVAGRVLGDVIPFDDVAVLTLSFS